MKKETKLLLMCVAIGVVVTIITAYFLYQYKTKFWRGQARNAFIEVLNQEVRKRNGTDVPFLTWGDKRLFHEQKEPIVVTLESEYGKKNYVIPLCKYFCNIEEDYVKRMLHTALFEERPLNVDSLELIWNNLLSQTGFSGESMVRLSITDLFGCETKAYSEDFASISKCDSLFSYYIGCRWEIEVTGFTHLSWWKVLSVKDMLQLGFIVPVCLFLFILTSKIPLFYRRYLVKVVPVEVIKEVPVSMEKEIPVIAVEQSRACVYQLDGGLLFDRDALKLKMGDRVVDLSPQTAILMHAFVKAEAYRLSIEEIQQLLWPNGDGSSSKMHMAVKRLRDFLSEVSDWTIKNGNYGYQLKRCPSME
ncbi:helix-turn-helix domain-containing protein [Bacteroides helcogenes]|nr:helix-turn-helix domain-containing protein [Bacteroides helcogenes]MDY5238117.1 helix-turn-helix domain-containing protein [Bacteroides helcogenes]